MKQLNNLINELEAAMETVWCDEENQGFSYNTDRVYAAAEEIQGLGIGKVFIATKYGRRGRWFNLEEMSF